MKLFYHEGKGVWLGSSIIVMAGTKKTAEKYIKKH